MCTCKSKMCEKITSVNLLVRKNTHTSATEACLLQREREILSLEKLH